MHDTGLLTTPIYTAAEIGRLVKLYPTRVQRWLRGYAYRYLDQVRQQAPVLRRNSKDERFASFLDLMEIRIARRFLAEGFSLQRVRAAFTEAAEVTGQDHPFANRVFYTLGRNIYLQIRHSDAGTENLLQLFSGGQWATGSLIRQDAARIDFDPRSHFARRWWPLGKEEPVVLDPAIGFGAATLVDRGMKTLNIYRMYMDEGQKPDVVARWLNIPATEVQAAVRWEEYRLTMAA